MTGQELKRILEKTGRSQAEIAALLNMSPQNFSGMLKVADVRTGLIEKLASLLDVPLSYFYGGGATATDHSVAINGGGNNINVDKTLVEVINRQSKQITDLINILSKANSYVQ